MELVMVYTRYYPCILLEINLNQELGTVPAEIRTSHLPNTSRNRYLYIDVFAFSLS